MDPREITQTLGNVVLAYVTALLFVSGNESSFTVLNNATAGFIDTGSAKLLVTNAHVLQEFDRKLRDDPSLRLMIGGNGRTCIVERTWLKDHYKKADLKLDLATFVLPDEVDPTIFGKAFYRSESWPPSRVAAGELVVIAGFQGVHRSQEGQSANMVVTVVADPVTTVNDVAFVLADEKVERVLAKINPALGDLGAFGGMSGSPAFRFAENGDHWLAGFLFETHDGLNAQVRCVHADFLLPDGRLDFGLLPY